MKVVIEAKAPTIYQLSSVSSFGLPVKSNIDGSYTLKEEFQTKKAAENWLNKRAEYYFETSKELREAKKDIKRGYLCIDAVTAYINKPNEF